MSKKKFVMSKKIYGKAEGENRTINMQFRVTEEELKQIEKRQAEMGILNRSGFLRKMVLDGICINVHCEELLQASRLLWSISNNMNQYAKKANTTGMIYLEDIDSMKEKQSELMQVYGKVLSELDKISVALEKLTCERGSVS